MTAKVLPMKPKKPASPLDVTPEAGWDLHSVYGSLQDVERRPLERLQAIHAYLIKRDGLTSMDAAVRVFGPFLSDANSEIGMRHGAAKLRHFLMLCDKADKAFSLFPSGKYSDHSHLERLKELVPYVPHHHFDRDTPEALLYTLAQMAGEVWAPFAGDVDLNDRPCAVFADGNFPSAESGREILGPLAVRHELANKLWGWGSVAQVVPLHSVSTEGQVEEPKTYAELVTFRTNKSKSEWTTSQKGIAAAEAKRRKALPGAKGVASMMAKELGVSVSRFNDLIRNPGEAGMREMGRIKSA